MAIIPLRAYNREIEGMIDNGQLDESVAHCRHILTTFPKHIATYRLLGKTHLEQQRISDATDLFQRVLSAIPDDFVSNVGMSIIREDENNLDGSIWHMELAYEAQPSNIAIQDELRRLYGRREGTQPPKARLTRGALARMYAKGGLLDQAVAELHAAFSEDPNRYDLQILLASMYFQSNQRVEAVETCVNILKKLPFCLAANQILAVCLPEADQSSTGKNYRQVAISMDPYFAHATQEAINSDQVPENAVNIEKLEWKSGIQMNESAAQPAWATSLGVSLDKKSEEVMPEWLKGTEAPISAEPSEKVQPSVSPFIWDTQEVEKIIKDDNKTEGEIPDWMKDAGWKPTSTDSAEKPTGEAFESPIPDIQPEEDLEKGNIPDWLRGIAPEGILPEEPSTSKPMEKDVSLPWLEKHQPGPTDSIIQWLEEAKPETPSTSPKPEVSSTEIYDEEVPDWLKDLDAVMPTTESEEPKSEEISALPPAPTSFTEDLVSEEVIPPQETTGVPYDELQEKVEKIEPIPEIVETPSTAEIIGVPPSAEVIETSPAAEILETGELPAAFADELPDWIKELAGEAPESVTAAPLAEEPGAEALSMDEEAPKVELTFPQEEAPAVESLAMPAEMSPIESPFVEARLETVQLEISADQIQTEQPTETDLEKTEGSPEAPSESIAKSWLNGLEIEEGAGEDELAPAVEEKQEVTPEWASLETEAITEEITPEPEPKVEEVSALSDEEIPDWIKSLGEIVETEAAPLESVSEISEEPEAQPAEELPAWLFESEPTLEETSAVGEPRETEGKEEELPDWIKDIAATTPTEEAPIPPELAVTRKLPPLPFEPDTEWRPTEISAYEPVEDKSIEPSSQEPEWVSIAETQVQAEFAEPIAAEGEVIAEIEVEAEEEVTTTAEAVTEVEAKIEEETIAEEEVLPEIAAEVEEEVTTTAEAVSEVEAKIEEVTTTEEEITTTAEAVTEVEAETEVTAEVEGVIESEAQVSAEAVVEAEVEAAVEAEAITVSPEIPIAPVAESLEEELVTLDGARNALHQGLPAQAAEAFSELIKHDHQLEDIIKEVQDALYRFPIDVNLWVVLGDAYYRNDQLQDALNAYSKAEDLVR